MTVPFAQAVSVDYSSDELDAIAHAFLRPDLARKPERAGGNAIARAQQQTALRGLVARRAIALGGEPAKPRITFLEPHATMLDAFLNAGAVATIRVEARQTDRATTLFAHGDSLVHHAALPGQEIHRLTASRGGPERAAAALERELELPGGPDEPERSVGDGRYGFSRSALRAAVNAIDADEPTPRDVPAGAADVLYARRASGSLTITARARDGARLAGTWTWIDAGALGLWQLIGIGTDGSDVSLQEVAPHTLRAELAGAWAQVLEEAAPEPSAG